MSARWGRPYRDQRDWPRYNDALVLRGEFCLDLLPLRQWDQELAVMNRGRRGGQYRIPESFIRWLVIWMQLIDYRGLEGITRRPAGLGLVPTFADYTTLWHRLHGFTPAVRLPKYSDLELASEGTGSKTSNAGEFRTFRYADPEAKQREHLTAVITADGKRKKVIGIEVYVEGRGHSEPQTGAAHTRAATARDCRVRKFCGDRANDTNEMFAALHETGTEPIIRIRKNAQPSGWHSPGRNRHLRRAVREYQGLGHAPRAE